MRRCWLWKWWFRRICSILQGNLCSSFGFWLRPENK
jgi:hypothetical protein